MAMNDIFKRTRSTDTDTVTQLASAASSACAVSADDIRKAVNLAFGAPVLGEKEEPKQEPEKWIWVEGYKATDKNMKCRDYQYEMNEQHDMPEGSKIEDCESGFHLCRDFKDVFHYYKVCDGNRFFRVRALVREKDYEEYGKKLYTNPYAFLLGSNTRDKLAAKSIVFLYEMTADEILREYLPKTGHCYTENLDNWSADDKKNAIEFGIDFVIDDHKARQLTGLGYSLAFARRLVSTGLTEKAIAVGSQPGLSMDMKVMYILESK